MTTLQTRLAQADKPSRELLVEVWNAVQPAGAAEGFDHHAGLDVTVDDGDVMRWIAYRKMLDAEAWTSAVEMLVPEGWIARRYMVTRYVPHAWEVAVDYAHGGWIGESDHSSALALAIACLKARGLA